MGMGFVRSLAGVYPPPPYFRNVLNPWDLPPLPVERFDSQGVILGLSQIVSHMLSYEYVSVKEKENR